MPLLKAMLETFGIEPERFRLEWVSASEGEKFASIVREMTAQIKELGPFRAENNVEALRKEDPKDNKVTTASK
jgi:F420-non-reducing hydrogenase iron-sulfur subunit